LVTNNRIDCNKKITKSSIKCRLCFNKNKIIKYKIEWPENTKLIQMLNESNFCMVGKKLGVSDNTVRKRIEKLKLFHLIS